MTATPEQKRILRKTKRLPGRVKAIVYGGNLGGPALAMQFNRDISLYGLWEALLYLEGYEAEGKVMKGTTERALEAALS